ncbi:hypothetical protein BH11PSE9_BH11PSE9_16160 [soil metagenome]
MHAPATLPSLAFAQIRPPRPRAGLVTRPALHKAIGDGLALGRLTLLVAPAGYGKTTALMQQIGSPAGRALAWVTAEAGDNLPRFLALLLAALAPHGLRWRVAPEFIPALAGAEHGMRDVAGLVVDAMASGAPERGLVVIDDAHRIVDARVFELLGHVLERLPTHWSIAVASRADLPLPLARWRAAGELAEFGPQALAFDEAEVASLLAAQAGHAFGNTPASSHASARAWPSPAMLLARTGGWPAGLRLLLSGWRAGASSLMGAADRSFSASAFTAGASRYLSDYFATEVFDDLPASLRSFLPRCASLVELTPEGCAELAGEDCDVAQASLWLAQIARLGLFVQVLDAAGPTLRLHPLFREFLQERSQRGWHDRATRPERLPPSDSVTNDVATLTEREREVLARLADGGSNKVIARAFDLSPHTVKRHVANILGKLGAQSRGQAAARWREQARQA